MGTRIENSDIREINMDSIRNEEMLDYMDGDIAIADDIRELPQHFKNDTIKVNMVLIAMCIKGKLQLDVNSKTKGHSPE